MIPNCEGCMYELEEAYKWIKTGKYFLAVSKDNEFIKKGHLYITIVDNKGKVVLQ